MAPVGSGDLDKPKLRAMKNYDPFYDEVVHFYNLKLCATAVAQEIALNPRSQKKWRQEGVKVWYRFRVSGSCIELYMKHMRHNQFSWNVRVALSATTTSTARRCAP